MARQQGSDRPKPQRRPAERLILVLPLGAALVGLPWQHICAQDGGPSRSSALGATTLTGPAPRLQVPPMVIAAPASETAFGIAIAKDGPPPANTYVRVRGLDPQWALTAGHVIAPGAWAVPLSALPNLRVVIPAKASGRSNLSIALIAIDGGVVAEAKTTLVVAPAALAPSETQRTPPALPKPAAPSIAALPPAKAPEAAPPPPVPASPTRDTPQPAPLSPAARERSEGFLARGRKLLEEGNIASARLFFRRAADEGFADGALALGTTFDPAELERLHAVGTRPDPAEARRWYEKARELGAGAAADRRLERLGSR